MVLSLLQLAEIRQQLLMIHPVFSLIDDDVNLNHDIFAGCAGSALPFKCTAYGTLTSVAKLR